MKVKHYLYLGLCLFLCNACQNYQTTDTKVEATQSKVNIKGEFIVTDDRVGKTDLPYATQSEVHALIKNYWGDVKPSPVINENIFSIEELLMLYGSNDKIVFAVENIPMQQVRIKAMAYADAQKLFADAENGNIYYFVLDRAFLDRKTPSDSDPNGIMYNKMSNGEFIRHLSFSIGTNVRGNQNWYYLIVEPYNNSNAIELRGEPEGVGAKVPPDPS